MAGFARIGDDIVKLRQSYFVPPVPYLVADELGLLADAGLEIESVRTRSSGEQFDGLDSGDLDLAITAIDNVFVWNERGADLRAVAQTEATTLLSVYGRAGVTAIAQVDGGVFAVDALSNGFSLVARWLLENAELTLSFEEVGGVKERLDALLAGRVDATLLGPPFDEFAEREGLVRLVSANDLLPDLAGQGVVVPAQRGPEQGRALAVYIDVLDEAVRRADAFTDEEGAELLARHGFPGRSAAEAWRTRPRTIAVEERGVALFESLRAEFNLLPRHYRGIDGIVDRSLTHGD